MQVVALVSSPKRRGGYDATTRKEDSSGRSCRSQYLARWFRDNDGPDARVPFGEDWPRLVGAYAATRTVRERVFKDTTGAGTTGVDDEYAKAYFANVGAEIMGAGMFGLHNFPDDPNWRGWWGDEPPFRVPVFVLTHNPRPSMEMAGGTTFRFLNTTPVDALQQAERAANGKDVRVGGGATVVRDFLKAGLVDRLHVAIAPILLGRGIRLWDDLRGLEARYRVKAETASSGTIHLTFQR